MSGRSRILNGGSIYGYVASAVARACNGAPNGVQGQSPWSEKGESFWPLHDQTKGQAISQLSH